MTRWSGRSELQQGQTRKKQQVKDNNGEALPQVTILKGEKSFPVFITTFTVVNKETREKIKYDDYRLMSEERRKEYNVYPKLQVYNVFNVGRPTCRRLVRNSTRNWRQLQE